MSLVLALTASETAAAVCNVVVSTDAVDQSRCRVENGLQSAELTGRKSSQEYRRTPNNGGHFAGSGSRRFRRSGILGSVGGF